MTDLLRRQYMSAVAAAAAARWDDEDYDIENVDEWEPMDGDTYRTATFTPRYLSATGEGKFASWVLEDEDLPERTMDVFYRTEAVHLTFEGADRERDVRAGSLADLSTDQAKELAAALYQAAEELRRREATDAD